jgi:molecular chaperone DnaJ
LSNYICADLQLTDHYSILELAPSATVDEIRAAYRRLAHIYHPDKNGNDAYAAAQFSTIKEAYETLTNPVKKEYYLQQRWYAQSTGQKTSAEIITPVALLKKMLELDQYASRLDIHRMDHGALLEYMAGILSDSNIQMLRSFNEPDVSKEILHSALRTANYLPYPLLVKLSVILRKLPIDDAILASIDKKIRQSRQAAWWERRRPLFLFIAVLLICLIIYWISN